MSETKGTVLVNRNAPCDQHWRTLYLTALQIHGYQVEHIPQKGLRDAVLDGQPRVYVDIFGDPDPKKLAFVLLEAVKLPAGTVGADFGSHGWQIKRREVIDLKDECLALSLAPLITETVTDFFEVASLD